MAVSVCGVLLTSTHAHAFEGYHTFTHMHASSHERTQTTSLSLAHTHAVGDHSTKYNPQRSQCMRPDSCSSTYRRRASFLVSDMAKSRFHANLLVYYQASTGF